MDSVLEKVGLYDFFAVFSGLIVLVISCCLQFPIIDIVNCASNDFMYFIIFLVGSYFLGIVL